MARSALELTVGFAAESVRETSPVVHCVAPRAATPFVADVLYGAGAIPVVTGTSTEALAAALSADAAMLDLGTLSAEWSDAVTPTLAAAREQALPWVLDVTQLGRLPLRADRVRALLGHRPVVVRLTSGELDGGHIEPTEGALVLGEYASTVVADGQSYRIPEGAPRLSRVPGVRSAVSALTAACATVAGPLEAALAASAWVALASTRAAEAARGPASFRSALVDELAAVRGDEIAEFLRF